jgi:hypothetical protein
MTSVAADPSIRPFQVGLPDEELADLRRPQTVRVTFRTLR